MKLLRDAPRWRRGKRRAHSRRRPASPGRSPSREAAAQRRRRRAAGRVSAFPTLGSRAAENAPPRRRRPGRPRRPGAPARCGGGMLSDVTRRSGPACRDAPCEPRRAYRRERRATTPHDSRSEQARRALAGRVPPRLDAWCGLCVSLLPACVRARWTLWRSSQTAPKTAPRQPRWRRLPPQLRGRRCRPRRATLASRHGALRLRSRAHPGTAHASRPSRATTTWLSRGLWPSKSGCAARCRACSPPTNGALPPRVVPRRELTPQLAAWRCRDAGLLHDARRQRG